MRKVVAIGIIALGMCSSPVLAYDGEYEVVEDYNALDDLMGREPDLSIQEHGQEVMRIENSNSAIDDLLGRQTYKIIDCAHSYEC